MQHQDGDNNNATYAFWRELELKFSQTTIDKIDTTTKHNAFLLLPINACKESIIFLAIF